MLMVFIELNDFCLYLYYAIHVGNLWGMLWVVVCMLEVCPQSHSFDVIAFWNTYCIKLLYV